MTLQQQQHCDEVAERFHIDHGSKYTAGQEHHGGNLFEKGLLFHAQACREEAVDLISYTDGMILGLAEAHKTVIAALAPDVPDCALRAYLGEIKTLLEGTDRS